jgi:hypothetical protein
MSAEVIAFATVVAGALGVPLVQGLKRLCSLVQIDLSGRPALFVTLAVAMILGVGVMGLTGALDGPVTAETLGAVVSGVFAVATVIYKVISNKTPEDEQSGQGLDDAQ